MQKDVGQRVDLAIGGFAFGPAIAHGVVGGIIGGIVMMLTEVVGSMLMELSPVRPLQMVAALVMGLKLAGLERTGMAPLLPATPTTVLVGVGLHLALSIVFGIILALLVLAVPGLQSSIWTLTVAGIAFGIALWLIKLSLIAVGAFPWVLTSSEFQQLLSHSLFGGALGYYAGRQLATRSRAIIYGTTNSGEGLPIALPRQ